MQFAITQVNGRLGLPGFQGGHIQLCDFAGLESALGNGEEFIQVTGALGNQFHLRAQRVHGVISALGYGYDIKRGSDGLGAGNTQSRITDAYAAGHLENLNQIRRDTGFHYRTSASFRKTQGNIEHGVGEQSRLMGIGLCHAHLGQGDLQFRRLPQCLLNGEGKSEGVGFGGCV